MFDQETLQRYFDIGKRISVKILKFFKIHHFKVQDDSSIFVVEEQCSPMEIEMKAIKLRLFSIVHFLKICNNSHFLFFFKNNCKAGLLCFKNGFLSFRSSKFLILYKNVLTFKLCLFHSIYLNKSYRNI